MHISTSADNEKTENYVDFRIVICISFAQPVISNHMHGCLFHKFLQGYMRGITHMLREDIRAGISEAVEDK